MTTTISMESRSTSRSQIPIVMLVAVMARFLFPAPWTRAGQSSIQLNRTLFTPLPPSYPYISAQTRTLSTYLALPSTKMPYSTPFVSQENDYDFTFTALDAFSQVSSQPPLPVDPAFRLPRPLPTTWSPIPSASSMPDPNLSILPMAWETMIGSSSTQGPSTLPFGRVPYVFNGTNVPMFLHPHLGPTETVSFAPGPPPKKPRKTTNAKVAKRARTVPKPKSKAAQTTKPDGARWVCVACNCDMVDNDRTKNRHIKTDTHRKNVGAVDPPDAFHCPHCGNLISTSGRHDAVTRHIKEVCSVAKNMVPEDPFDFGPWPNELKLPLGPPQNFGGASGLGADQVDMFDPNQIFAPYL
ncbi:hypothetical protein B0H21DRAFT_724233 [Amylocystis lapponica]|nr:hypothetical protein B0H21DRAFT_724233 [Amylocystis lapponica]